MKKIFFFTVSILSFLIISIVTILSTVGYETNRFNELISKQIIENNKEISVKLQKIKFKFDVKKIKLYLETKDPYLVYQNVQIPIQEVKTYINFLSIINSTPKIDKLSISLNKIDINQLKKLIIKTKPSNLNSFILNNVKSGEILTNIEFFFTENLRLQNFIARGKVAKMNAEFLKKLNIENTSFSFFADDSDILIKDINSKMDGIIIKRGNLQISKGDNIVVTSDFNSEIKLNSKNINTYLPLISDLKLSNKNNKLIGEIDSFLNLTFDKTFKLVDYKNTNKGKVKELLFVFNKPIENLFIDKQISNLYLKDTVFDAKCSFDNKNELNVSGNYSIDDKNYQKFNVKNIFEKNSLDMVLSLDTNQKIKIDVINFEKEINKDAKINLDLNFNKKNSIINIKQLDYLENKNAIIIKNLKIKKNKFLSLEKLKIKTYQQSDLKNDFDLSFKKKIIIKGKRYDARNLNKYFSKKLKTNYFKNINANIDIDFNKIETPLSEKLLNFKLLGMIEKGKFNKISSKGDFGNNKYLDISMRSDEKNKKKYLEIYSDLPQPLLSEYNFFKGLNGGVLNYSSVIEEKSSTSKMVIDNFKVINAPGVVKLLSLADFGGLVDLAEGEGLSFDKMEMNLSTSKGLTRIDELYAVGPSISVLMEGYKEDNGLTSLRGTLVPAKNLNKLLSKIPVIGKIIIPDEIGEGLFGVSFKMKGMPGEIKTSINPVKSLTPRFITRALEKNKNSK